MQVKFGTLKVGDLASGWGDLLTNYDRATWITFEKVNDWSAKIVSENDKPLTQGGMRFCISENDEVTIKD
jgi:hypothetical protein